MSPLECYTEPFFTSGPSSNLTRVQQHPPSYLKTAVDPASAPTYIIHFNRHLQHGVLLVLLASEVSLIDQNYLRPRNFAVACGDYAPL